MFKISKNKRILNKSEYLKLQPTSPKSALFSSNAFKKSKDKMTGKY